MKQRSAGHQKYFIACHLVKLANAVSEAMMASASCLMRAVSVFSMWTDVSFFSEEISAMVVDDGES